MRFCQEVRICSFQFDFTCSFNPTSTYNTHGIQPGASATAVCQPCRPHCRRRRPPQADTPPTQSFLSVSLPSARHSDKNLSRLGRPVDVDDSGPGGKLSTISFLSRCDDRLGQVRESGNQYYRSMQKSYGCTERLSDSRRQLVPQTNSDYSDKVACQPRACSMDPCC